MKLPPNFVLVKLRRWRSLTKAVWCDEITCDPRFWKFYDQLPKAVQAQADAAYELWQRNPFHGSLQFKRVDAQDPIYSVRVGRGYRALGWREGDTISWSWIGDHDEYDRLLR